MRRPQPAWRLSDFAEAIERRFQVLVDLVGWRREVGVVERVVLESKNVAIDFFAGDELGMVKTPESLACKRSRSHKRHQQNGRGCAPGSASSTALAASRPLV